jgi:hypothetical protein
MKTIQDRVNLIKKLREKYQHSNWRLTTLEKVAKEHNLKDSEVKYIFFSDDIYIREVVISGL